MASRDILTQVLLLLKDSQSANQAQRLPAELQLQQLHANPSFPACLLAVGTADGFPPNDVDIATRIAALLILRTFVDKNYSGHDEDGPTIQIDEATKEHLRVRVLALATSDDADRKIKSTASLVVSKIANVDFPDQWPNLLPTILHVLRTSPDSQVHGALKVLGDLVEDSLSEDTFFTVARDIVKVVYDVATNDARKLTLRATAVSVFRGCFDIMDMVKDEHDADVKAFAGEAINTWLPFFLAAMKQPLPTRPKEGGAGAIAEQWRGVIALKLQVVKTLMRIRAVFPSLLLPQTPVLFSATWEELSLLQAVHQDMYVDNDEQGRLEDADGLPYTLDFLVLEELDFLQSCLRAPPVQHELEAQLQAHSGVYSTPWVTDVMKLAVSYAQICKEEEDLWDIDVNLFLAEETSVTANYTARTAAGDLLIKTGEWLHQGALEGLLAYTQLIFSSGSSWRMKEASLYLLTQLMSDFLDTDKKVADNLLESYLGLIQYAISRDDEPLLRARGYLVAGVLAQSAPAIQLGLFDRTIEAVNSDDSEVVKVSCIKALQGHIVASATAATDRQLLILKSISDYVYAEDLTDLEDADDLLITLVESLKDTISIEPGVVLKDGNGALDLLFSLSKHGAANFQMIMLVSEAFEDICCFFGGGGPLYAAFCAKVLPSLTGAFDVGSMTDDNPLIEFAAELLAVLTEHGSEPLPPGYVASALPKLNRLLMNTTEGAILRPGVEAVKFMLMHDHQQVFSWHDENNVSGLEVCLILIDRLLGPTMEDNAASEVGGLAAELVEKAGTERLGPFLAQLLRAVATRLATAEAAPFIQSLILVFARLSLTGAHDVVEFLCQTEINGTNGLQVVLSKWLENSINFAGYDEIRQNVIALSKIYSLNDPRVVQTMVKGSLIIPTSNRIMTRSKSKLSTSLAPFLAYAPQPSASLTPPTDPDQYTVIPAPLKIIKVLIEELLSASGLQTAATALAAADFGDDEFGLEDDNWEDVPSTLDLSAVGTKAELMAFGNGEGAFMRQRDDETQAYLTDFFIKAGRENLSGFNELYEALDDKEKMKLVELAQGA